MPAGQHGIWHVWKNTEGMTVAIREHLKGYHEKQWRETVVAQRLKGWEELSGMAGPAPTRRHHEPFTVRGFQRRLVKWIVEDDQVCCLIFSLLLLLLSYSQSNIPAYPCCRVPSISGHDPIWI